VPEQHADYRLLHWAAYLALFCLGVQAAAIGPVLPFLADDLDVSLDTAGLLLTAFFVGSITSSAAVALALHARDVRMLCVLGLAAQTTGALLVVFAPSWEIVLAAGVIFGTGDGLVIAATHILMPATSDDAPSALNRLNLFFALGAIAGPIWAGAILSTNDEYRIVYAGIAVVFVLALAVMIAADVAVHRPIAGEHDAFRLPGNPTAWIMGAVLFLYVGAEFGLGAWVSSFARETADAGVFGAALITAGYWAALALGRVAAAWYFAGRRDAVALLAVGCAGAGLWALVLALSSGSIVLASVAVLGAGFFLGPIWPTVTAIAAESSEASATAATVTIGNAGGVAIPWAQGKVLVGAGATQGVAVTAVLCVVMFGIVAGFRARRGRVAAAADVVRV
jgi:fucose permease